MDWTILADVLQFLALGGIGWAQWQVSRRRQVTDEIETKVDTVRERAAQLEQRVDEMPQQRDLGKIYDRINHVSGEVRELIGEVKALTHQLHLMHEDRLAEGRRGQ